jgi:hypothetical protein
MGIVKTEFTHIECNGPAATPFKAHCTAEADGGWDQAEVEKAALLEGWTNQARSWFCPKHSVTPQERPSRKPRAVAEQSPE